MTGEIAATGAIVVIAVTDATETDEGLDPLIIAPGLRDEITSLTPILPAVTTVREKGKTGTAVGVKSGNGTEIEEIGDATLDVVAATMMIG